MNFVNKVKVQFSDTSYVTEHKKDPQIITSMIREQTFVILCQKKLVILRKLVTTYSLSLKRSIQLK